ISALERGDQPRDRAEVRALADTLGLRLEPLERIVLDKWVPQPVPALPGIETIHGDVSGYAVKGYVIHDEGEALIVDTAYNASAMIEFLESNHLRLIGICLTHGHSDHSDGIQQLLKRWTVPIYLGESDRTLLHWRPPEDRLVDPQDGSTLSVGRHVVRCMATPGHTPGGFCYMTELASRSVCFVGDTLFAGSIGRSSPHTLYERHLDSVRERVLKLSQDSVLLPGHGPATTVQEEVQHNPFALDQ
ncbi:MAG TPA: MBL fold metallo-hydrolase, partial [Nitrospiraceae bacterium]